MLARQGDLVALCQIQLVLNTTVLLLLCIFEIWLILAVIFNLQTLLEVDCESISLCLW